MITGKTGSRAYWRGGGYIPVCVAMDGGFHVGRADHDDPLR